ncbi:MFS transporter [Meiothermus sp. PNK-Is4]|nr:MFS transporter [Meiothermus sp. Pnk-1]RYM36231.1 MFS transporter [Meiothermus sp. PNK-Is4]
MAARLAVYTYFFVCGLVFAAWVSRIPAIKDKLALEDGELGLVLFGVPAGLMVAMPLTGWAISRLGSRWVVTVAALLNGLILPLLALAPSGAVLFLALFFFGFTQAAMDISMNAQAVEVEKRYARPIMSSFHALFSLGGLVGAALGGAAAGLEVAPLPFFALVSLFALGVILGGFRWLILTPSQPAGTRFVWPRGVLLGLGLILFCTGLGEGAVADWSAVFMKQSLGAGEALAALAFSAFSVAMVIGRLGGDALHHRFGPVRLARVGGLLAATGLGLAVGSSRPYLALLGFVLVGFGYCTLFPLVFSAAGKVPGVHPGIALASVATLGYAGFLVGPPLIGLMAEAISLPASLGMVAVLALLIAALAGLLRTAQTGGQGR